MSCVGLALYTVRDDCARDFPATLEAVAGLGFEGVELHSLFGNPVDRVRGWLGEAGLTVAARHVGLEELESRLEEHAAEAATLGTTRLVVPWIEAPKTVAGADATADRLDRLARAGEPLGIELCFHNHWAELTPLDDGRSLLDRLLDRSLSLELDLGWAWWAGIDPVALLERSRGRVPVVHLKDFRDRESDSFCPVGDGAVGYERVVAALEGTAVEWLLVEQDETDGPALEAAARSLAALTPMLEAA